MMRFKKGNVCSIMLNFWLLSKKIRFKYVQGKINQDPICLSKQSVSIMIQANAMWSRGRFTASPCYFHTLHFQNCSNISAKNLQQQLEALELDSREWSASAKEYERVLSCSLEFCTTREEINEVGFAKGHTEPKACVSVSMNMHACLHTDAHTCTESEHFLPMPFQSQRSLGVPEV